MKLSEAQLVKAIFDFLAQQVHKHLRWAHLSRNHKQIIMGTYMKRHNLSIEYKHPLHPLSRKLLKKLLCEVHPKDKINQVLKN